MLDHDVMALILIPFFTLVLPMAFIFGVPFAKRMHKRMELKDQGLDQQSARELEEMKHRLAEVEERLDFAERLLAQSRESHAKLSEGPDS